MTTIQAIHTIAMTVADADRSQGFYIQALGFKLVSDVTFEIDSYDRLACATPSPVRIVTLQLGDEFVELIEFIDLDSQPIPADSQSNDLWFQHMAIVVSDMDRAYEHLQAFPIEPISEGPQTIPANNPMAGGVRAFKFRDPDRHGVELIWFPEDKGKAKWHHHNGDLFLGIDHSAIAIASSQESLAFYRDLLGMEVADSGINEGATQAALDNLSVAEVHIDALQPAKSSMGIELLDYVQPGTGRCIPNDWQMSDLAHRHLILEVDNLQTVVESLEQQKSDMTCSYIVDFVDFAQPYRFERGCLVKDPNGNALLLATSS